MYFHLNQKIPEKSISDTFEVYSRRMNDLYDRLRQTAADRAKGYQKQINRLAFGRLFLFLAGSLSIYFYYIDQSIGLWLTGLSVLIYIYLVKKQDKLKIEKRLQEELITINEREIAFLKGDVTRAESGDEFLPINHPFAADLDLFGDKSLFQFLNRASTSLGRSHLAKTFLSPKVAVSEIIAVQESIKELKPRLEWRQLLHALGSVQMHIDDAIQQIKGWKAESGANSKTKRVLSYLVPGLFLLDVVLYLIFGNGIFEKLLWVFVAVNMLLTGSNMKSIKKELIVGAGISKSLEQCVRIFNHIKNADFKSPKLSALKGQIGKESITAINDLSTIMARLESVQNGFGVIFMSGTLQYHVHALFALEQWKEKHKDSADHWFEIIGEMEALSSIAQFGFSNEQYVFPEFNSDKRMSFEEVGHPLIPSRERVTNSIDFNHGQLVILTGSNMSGKSTFLRTIGINLVLAKCGAPVCASTMNIDPIPLYVHMKVSDSLAGGQSYFFAEVDRLRFIKTELDKGPGFVLLDEILRGTNSEDKQVGTMEFLKKLKELNALGIVATHDLGVCELAKTFPDSMINKRFEVEMNEEELHFDYKLRDGICENKNASVILRKSGII